MAKPAGSFIWYELMTPDPDGAAAFSHAVVGWRFAKGSDTGPGGVDYRHIVRSDGGSSGGVLALTMEMMNRGTRPAWLPYLHVVDVDEAIAAIVAGGGKVFMPKTTIASGSFALLADPQGVPIYIMAPVPPAGRPDAQSEAFSVTEPQHVRWNELASPDQQASMDFYARHFNFAFKDRMPMGEMGDYCFIDHGGTCLGAIMRQQDPGLPPMWLPYIGVPSIVAAKAAVEAGGGTVAMGPHEVPGGDWIIVGFDPQGALFGLVGPRGK